MARFATASDIRSITTTVRIDGALRLLKQAESYDAILGDPSMKDRFDRLVPGAGTVVGSLGDGTVQVLDCDSHDVIVASSGRKKTRSEIIPAVVSMALRGHPLVINDMKAEIFEATKGLLDAMGYRVLVLDYRNPGASPNSFNPLSQAWHDYAAGRSDAAAKGIRNIAEILYCELASTTTDAFWPAMAVSYFNGLALGMLERGQPLRQFTIDEIFSFSVRGCNHLRSFFGSIPESVAAKLVQGTIWAPNETRSSIESVFSGPLAAFTSQSALVKMMSRSDFNAADLAKPRTALFVISPDEEGTVAPIVTAVISQIMTALVALAQERPDGRLEVPVQFILDEFGNLRPIPNFEHIVSAARSRGVRLHVVLQSTSQLDHVYGSALRKVIVSNLYNWIYMGTRDLGFNREFVEQLGSFVLPSGREAPTLTVKDLCALEKRREETEAVILMESIRPYVAVMPDYGSLEPLPKRV